MFDVNPVNTDIDPSEFEWELDWIDINDVDAETQDHKEESNVALSERRQAVEKAQLTVGEGNPLVVVGEDNVLIEGYTRYNLVRDHFEESEVPVYRGVPTAEASQKSPEIATAVDD